MGLILCSVAFLGGSVLTLRSLVAGLAAVLTAGYLFGILRANFLDTFSHFIFDAAVLGFFLAFFGNGTVRKKFVAAQQPIKVWLFILLGWVGIMFVMPMQHPLIQLVGLRGNGFLLPFLLVGSFLNSEQTNRLALWLSVLNHMAFGFAAAEFVLGVPTFFPVNAVTEIIYNSGDVAGHTAYRIPACFSNAHSYGGTMLITLPWLLGAWVQPQLGFWHKLFLGSGMMLAMLGVFLCAARTPILLLAVLILLATFSGKIRGSLWIGWGILLCGIVYVVASEERMQRFMSLKDTDYVLSRVEGSVNMNFVELLGTYPLGNGLGAGGTSIPYFLRHLVHNPVGLENEYSRILLEQGLIGLVLWLAFIAWLIGRWPMEHRDPWTFGKRLIWLFSVTSFGMALIGTGLMTAIPQGMLFFLGIGFCAVPRPIVRKKKTRRAAGVLRRRHRDASVSRTA